MFGLYAGVRQLSVHDPASGHELWKSGARRALRGAPAVAAAARRPGASSRASRWRATTPTGGSSSRCAAPRSPCASWSTAPPTGPSRSRSWAPVRIPYLGTLDVWRLTDYGGGLFVPVKDALAGVPGGTYGGGRYLLDTVKGADLGSGADGDSARHRLQLRLQPVVRLRPVVVVPARAAGQHPARGHPGRRADAALTGCVQAHAAASARVDHGERDERAACVVETLPGRASSRGRPMTLIRRTDAPTGAFATSHRRVPIPPLRGASTSGGPCPKAPVTDITFSTLGVPARSSRPSPPTARPPRSRSRSTPCPTRSPDATCSAAARPARARPSPSRSRWSPASAGARRRQAPPRPSARPRARADPRARHPDRRGARAARRRLRPDDHHDLRRHQPEAPGRRAPRRRRHRRRLPRPPRGPHEAGPRDPRRDRDHRARRGRPHGRPRLPPRRHAHHGQDPAGRPAPAVLRHARQRRGQARPALPAERGAALGRRGQLATSPR